MTAKFYPAFLFPLGIYVTEICMEKQYKSSIIKNHKTIEKIFDGIPLKGYVAS